MICRYLASKRLDTDILLAWEQLEPSAKLSVVQFKLEAYRNQIHTSSSIYSSCCSDNMVVFECTAKLSPEAAKHPRQWLRSGQSAFHMFTAQQLLKELILSILDTLKRYISVSVDLKNIKYLDIHLPINNPWNKWSDVSTLTRYGSIQHQNQ